MGLSGTPVDCAALTDTEREILAVLCDGGLQTPGAMIERLSDPHMNRDTLIRHVSNIRTKLSPSGVQILHRVNGKRLEYVLARPLPPWRNSACE